MNQFYAGADPVELEGRVLHVIASTFRLSNADVSSATRLGSIPQWDSLGHMQLIVAIERAFAVTIPNFAVAELVTVPEIVRTLVSLDKPS